MRVTFVGHACHLVEVGGLRILSDPWLVDPIFDGLVEHAPTRNFGVADLPPIDVITLSHGHLDHFNAPTLAALPDKQIPVVHPPVRFTELDRNLKRLGFEHLEARADYEPYEIGDVRITPTPSQGVLDECAFFIEGPSGRFWNGVDAPQPEEVVREIRSRLGVPDLAALSHNSFDQPSLLGLPSFKDADHGPRGAAVSARILGCPAALAAASNLRWCGPKGPDVTRKVIRRGARDLTRALAEEAPDTELLDLSPGDAWSREGGIERGVVAGTAAPRVATDSIHAVLGDAEDPQRPSTEETFLTHLPALLRARREAAHYVGQRVAFEITGDDPGHYTVDFTRPDATPEPGCADAAYGLQLPCDDWKDLFARRLAWQVMLMTDRLRVTRVRRGAPPEGLHFAYALQAVFP